MDDDIKRLAQETCLALIPQFYGENREAVRIQQVNDNIIEPFAAAIMRLNRNAYIQTMDSDALSDMELGLGIVPSGTLEQRRQAVIDALCDMLVVNDDYAVEVARAASGEDDMSVDTDPVNLTSGVHRSTNTDDGNEVSQIFEAISVLKPIVPQNLELYAQINTEKTGTMMLNHAHRSAISCSLGTLKYHPVPVPVPPADIYIGTTTTCPAGTTALYSPYFWMYAFSSSNGTNWWNPSYYQDATPPISDSSLETVGGTRYAEVILTNGSGGTTSPTLFRLAEYSNRPELYMDSSYNTSDSLRNGAIVKFGAEVAMQQFNLPTDLYSISGTTISWNMSHPLMVLLSGKVCTPQ